MTQYNKIALSVSPCSATHPLGSSKTQRLVLNAARNSLAAHVTKKSANLRRSTLQGEIYNSDRCAFRSGRSSAKNDGSEDLVGRLVGGIMLRLGAGPSVAIHAACAYKTE